MVTRLRLMLTDGGRPDDFATYLDGNAWVTTQLGQLLGNARGNNMWVGWLVGIAYGYHLQRSPLFQPPFVTHIILPLSRRPHNPQRTLGARYARPSVINPQLTLGNTIMPQTPTIMPHQRLGN